MLVSAVVEAAARIDVVVASSLVPLALFIVLNGLDDLVIDFAITWAWLRRRRGIRPEAPPAPSETVAERRIAVLVPLWNEAEVIGGMVRHNIAAIRYRHYDFFIGAYPNDDATLEAVRELENISPASTWQLPARRPHLQSRLPQLDLPTPAVV